MAIKITVGDSPEVEAQEEREPKVPQVSMKMNARKTLDGSLAIYDHLDIDIVVVPKSNKVLALAKNSMSDEVYDTQSRMFDYLVRKGVVLPEPVRGGNVYGSMEAIVPASAGGLDETKVVFLLLGSVFGLVAASQAAG